MSNNSTPGQDQPQENVSDQEKSKTDRRALIKATRQKIEADNLARKDERNARRWKAERDPEEYDQQKAGQREEYAQMIRETEGRDVRAYTKVPGQTPAERAENRRKRKAERQRKNWANASQAEKDAKADRVWIARQRKKGLSEAEIEAGLAKRRADREGDRVNSYADNDGFGAF